MSTMTTEQMAELLVGIARSQIAMADAMENFKPGFKATHLRPAAESAARIKMNRPVVLSDFPARVLLQMLGRNPPTLDAVTRELESLLNQNAAVTSGLSLDMTKS